MGRESLRQRARPAPPAPKLSGDELTAVLQEASRLQGEALKQEAEVPALKSEDNVFAIAEELGIPEEHVRAALATQQAKARSAGGGTAVSLVAAGAGGLLAGVGLAVVGVPALLAVPLAAAIQITLAQIPALAPLAVLMGSGHRYAKKTKASPPPSP